MNSKTTRNAWGRCLIIASVLMCMVFTTNSSWSNGTNRRATDVKAISAFTQSNRTEGQTWTANPLNYHRTKNIAVNDHVRVPILEYHEANYVPGNPATLKPGQLLAELQWLHRHGFHTINFGQLYAAMYYGYTLPKRPVLLTFDDGYESVYYKVFPLLKRFRDQATLFIVPGYTHEKPDRTKEFPTLTISELQEMQESGLVDVEDHTVSHRDLTKLTLAQVQYEIESSAKWLESVVHHPMFVFCYPYGHYTPQILRCVTQAGFLLGVTEHKGYANLAQGPLTLDRLTVFESMSLEQFAAALSPSLRGGT
jgi:peptidoglycan/xylan/chitin deacetylase (PgdA/CDA1 family)